MNRFCSLKKWIILAGISIFSPLGIFSQSNTPVNIKAKDTPITKVLKEIERQTPYRFSYKNAVLSGFPPVTMTCSDTPTTQVLDRIFAESDLTYEILSDKSIVIVARHATKASEKDISKKTIKGRVTDAAGEPLIGASVIAEGTTSGISTDMDGNYTLSGLRQGQEITVSYIGYTPVTFKVGNKDTYNLTLDSSDNLLDEVVVVGYGTQKKVNLTGSVAALDGKSIEDIPASNLTSALSGRLSGVNITQTAGKPGGGSSLSIRAEGTWNSTTPLYVIDGVVRDKFAFDGLDASDVENISVLKDGASAAIYGSRAANGVVLVTTRKGRAGKPTISYTGSVGISEATKIPDMYSAYGWAQYCNDSYRNNNIPETDNRYYADDELQYFKEHPYDWIDETWKSPVTTRHSVNVSGGNERVRYFVGGNYYYETGSFDNLKFNKYTVRSNIDANITKDVKIFLGMSLDTRDDHKPYWTYDWDNDNMSNLYNGVLRRGIFAPYIDGKPNGTYLAWHPIEVINGKNGYNKKRYSNYEVNASIQYDVPFVPGLSLKLSYNNYQRHTLIKQFNRPYDLYVFKTTGSHNHIQTDELDYIKTRNDGDFLYEKYNSDRSYQLNAMATYNRKFGVNEVNALFVYEQSESTNDWLTGQRNYFISSAIDQMFAGSSDNKDSSANGSGSESGRISYVGRLGYTFDNRYLLEASFRYDGSVNFSPKRRWGFFPSVSAAWRISQEKFFQENVSFIDYMKLRASIGKLGNDAVGGWQWMQRYNLTTGAYFGSLSNGVAPGVIPNINITWEKSVDVDYGIDLAFLHNRLSLSVSGFHKHTYDILGSRIVSLPSTFGGSMPAENYATINTKGFEIEATYNDMIGKEFSYHIGGNFGYATNKLIEMDEAQNLRPYQSQLGFNTDRAMGYMATGILRTQADIDALPEGYTIFGQKPELGMLNYRDIRGANSDEPDGKIDSNDQEWIISHTNPPIVYGFQLGCSWKGISVDMFFQGRSGGKRFYDQRTEWPDMEAAGYAWRSDYWTPENTTAQFPRAGENNGASEASTFWIQDTSFLRFKNLNIGYQLPRHLLTKLGVEQLKFFLMGSNLFLLHDKIKAYDPENSSITNYPLMRTYSFGINLSF